MRDYRPDYRFEDKPPVWVQCLMLVLLGIAFYSFIALVLA